MNMENRNIFIDCGSHQGQSIKKFKTLDLFKENHFEIYAFEANQEIIEEYGKQNPEVIIMNYAAWVEDKEMNFYLDRTDADGSSLLEEKKHPFGYQENDLGNPLKVRALDFSLWILNTFNKNDYIILKMDIEGAEYEVISKMIEDKSLEYVNELYVECHYKKVSISKKIHDTLIKKIKTVCSITCSNRWNPRAPAEILCVRQEEET